MDVSKVKELIALMNENDLGEIEIEEEGAKIRLKKREIVQPQVVQPVSTVPPESTAAPPTQEEPAHSDHIEIISPMVGTFYRASSPDAEPYVDVGSTVDPETVVCIIEAMKVMNEIRAEMHGEIVDVLVESGEPVEYGQPLFAVRPLGSAKTAEE